MVISEIDKQIIAFVELQAEKSIPELACEAGLRTHSVYYGLNKLEREGVIRRMPFINMPKLGYSDYLLLFSLAVHDTKRRDELIIYLQKNPLVTWLAEVGGNYQYGAALYVKSSAELFNFLADLSAHFGGLFFEKAFSLHTRFARFNRTYLFPSAPRRVIQHAITDKIYEIDDIDNRILVALTENGSQSAQEIARLLGIPFSTLHYRLQTLKKQGILDAQIYSIHTKGLGATLPNKLFNFSKKHPNVVYFIQCIGNWDFELGIEVETMHQATRVVQEIYAAFADTITTITTIPLFRQLKFKFYRADS